MENTGNKGESKPFTIINSAFFILFLVLGAVLFFLIPKDKISAGEKRILAQLPGFNYDNLISGKFADSLNTYYSDNFIFRNRLITIAHGINEYLGIKNEELKLYTQSGAQIIIDDEEDEGIQADTIERRDTLIKAGKQPVKKKDNDKDYENINSIIVYRKKAVQLFGGSKKVVAGFAAALKNYKKELGPDINIYCMPIPIGSDFYLPPGFSRNKTNEKSNIEHLYNCLDSSIISVKVYEELMNHADEYIQFNTDHHWTGRGAYYGYRSFCNAAGIESLPMESLTRKVIPNFLGSLYYLTLSSDLKNNRDSVEYFKIPTPTKAFYFNEDLTNPKPTKLYVENARGGNSYGVFLGADFPMMRILSEVKNGKKILEIKDSYGNAFAPFLPAHFEEVFVIDYRYFNGNIKDLVKKYGITDIVFSHNLSAINSGYAAKRANYFLNFRNSNQAIEEPKPKTQSAAKSGMGKDSLN